MILCLESKRKRRDKEKERKNKKKSSTVLRRGGEAVLAVRPPRRTPLCPPDSRMVGQRENRGRRESRERRSGRERDRDGSNERN